MVVSLLDPDIKNIMKKISEFQLAQSIDQTNLNPLLSYEEFRKFIQESRKLDFASVAILPMYTKIAKEILQGSNTKVDVAISYPFGSVPAWLKAKEIEFAIRDGADEIDYVVNIAAVKSLDYKTLLEEARMIVSASEGKTVKAIIEMWNLTKDEIRFTCETILESNVAFIKSSTAYKGYTNMRASTVEDALLLKKIVGDRTKIKIAGGIKDINLTLELLSLGVNRIGTSSGVQILSQFQEIHQNG